MPIRPIPLTTWNKFQSSTLQTSAQGLLDGLQKQLEEATAPLQVPQAPAMPSLPSLAPLSEWTSGWGGQPAQGEAPSAPAQASPQQPSWLGGLPSLDELTAHWAKPEQAAQQQQGAAPPRPVAAGGTPSAMPSGQAPGGPEWGPPSGNESGTIEGTNRPTRISSAYRYARAAEQRTGVPAEVSLAFAVHESGLEDRYGPGFNYHGRQALPDEDGTPYEDWSPNGQGGQTTYAARLKRYQGPAGSFDDFADLIATGGRYKPALDRYKQTGDKAQLIRDIWAAGYGESPTGPDETVDILNRQVSPLAGQAPAAQQRPVAPSGTPTPLPQGGGGALDMQDIATRYGGGSYVFGGGRDGEGGIPGAKDSDCSSFVSGVWRERGVPLTAHTDAAYSQLRQMGAAEVGRNEAQPGDVVFFMGEGYGGALTYHMGIYAGNGQILDQSRTGGRGEGGVRLRPLTHAGSDIVILRDPRMNGAAPRRAETPPPIVPTGLAEETGGEKPTQAQLNAAPSPSPAAAAALPPGAGVAPAPAPGSPALAQIGLQEPGTQAAYGDTFPPAPYDNRDADQGPRESGYALPPSAADPAPGDVQDEEDAPMVYPYDRPGLPRTPQTLPTDIPWTRPGDQDGKMSQLVPVMDRSGRVLAYMAPDGEPPYDPRDADQGPHEATPGSVGAAPLPAPSTYNDPTDGGTQQAPVPYAAPAPPAPPAPISPADDPGGAAQRAQDYGSTPLPVVQGPQAPVNPLQPGTLRPSDLPLGTENARPWLTAPAPRYPGIQAPPQVIDAVVPRAAQTAPARVGVPDPAPTVAGLREPRQPFEELAPYQDEQPAQAPGGVQGAISAAGRSRFLNESQGRQAVDIYNAIQELPFETYARARQQLISDAEARRMSGTDPLAPFRGLGISLPSAEEINPDGRPASDVAIGLLLQGALPDPMDPAVQVGLLAIGKTLGVTARGVAAGARAASPAIREGAEAVGRGVRGLADDAGRALPAEQPGVMQLGSGFVPNAPTGNAPTFYSHLRRTIEEKMPNRAAPGQVQGIIRSGQVKPDEVAWTGIDDWLREQRGPVTKQQVLDFLDQNEVKIEEVVKGGPVDKQGALRALDGRNNVWPESRPNGDPLTRDEVLNAPEGARFIVGGNGTKYGQYTLPGGENYRELLLTLPESANTRGANAATEALEREVQALGLPTNTTASRILEAGGTDDLAQRWTRYKLHGDVGVPYESYTSSHWSEPNVLAHVRFNDRTGPNGEKILLIEEVQSDWHQAGRKSGYRLTDLPPEYKVRAITTGETGGYEVVSPDGSILTAVYTRSRNNPATPEQAAQAAVDYLNSQAKGVPAAPFAKTWPELSVKRMIRWAAENGYDRIAWPPGAVHAERYSLARQIDSLEYNSGAQTLYGYKGRDRVVSQAGVTPEQLPDYIGQEVAERLLANKRHDNAAGGASYALDGQDLKVGGEGMAGFYDQILPSVAQKLGKKFGARVGTTKIDTIPGGPREMGDVLDRAENPDFRMQTVHSMDITPAMRESALSQGQPLFSAPAISGGPGLRADLGNAAQGAAFGGYAAPDSGEIDEDERRRRMLAGAGLGVLAGRRMRGQGVRAGERLAGSGFVNSPNYRPPTPAQVARATREGARRGAMLNQEVRAPASEVPGRVRAVTAATDDRAGLRWAEDMLSDAAGNPRMRENDPARPSTQSRVNAGSIANERIQNELEPAIVNAGRAGVHDEIPQYLEDVHAKDILDEFYNRGYQEAWDRHQQAISAAQASGKPPAVIQRMQARQQQAAHAAGEAKMRTRQGGNPDMTYEAIEARLQAQEARLKATGQWDALQESAQGVWDHNAATRQRLVDAGELDADTAAHLAETYPHYVPTVPISHLDARGGGPVASAAGPRVSRGSQKAVSAFEDVGTSGERLNPIVASRNATVRAERQMQRNRVAAAFATMMDDALGASPGTMVANAATHRTFLGGGTDITFMQDGKPVTMSVPKAVADGIEAAANMGADPGTMGRIWRRIMGTFTSTMTAGRASFLPVNVVRDLQDFALRTASHEGGPGALPGVMGTWMSEAGNAAADIFKAQANVRGGAGAAIGGVYGAAIGDEDTTVAERIRHAAEGAVAGTFLGGANRVKATGKAREYLARGGGSGGVSAHWGAGQRWYREVMREGGAVINSPASAARYFGDWLGDIATLQGVKGINERAELVSRTAAMRRADQEGLAPVEAMTRGRDASYDPDRAGTVARAINGIVPFFNASVQGAAQTGRLLKQHPIAAPVTIAATVAPVMLLAEAWNRSDPDRARTYDDIPQYIKDSGLVIVTGGSGSDNRGARPNYLWIPTGGTTPFVIGMRKAMENLPGLEQTAGRTGSRPDASELERWGDALANVAAVFSPLRGESPSALASNLVPQGVKQVVEVGLNKDLYRGNPIVTDNADERASAFSRSVAGGANTVGRTIGSDALQNVHPSQVEHLVRSLPAYGDIVTGASDQVDPSGYKRAEDRPIANEPFLGGIGSRFARDQGGANLERAQGGMIPDAMRPILEAANMRPEDITPVPSRYKGAALTREEQVRWQEATNALVGRAVADASRSPEWRERGADREKLVKDAISRAREDAAARALSRIDDGEVERRKQRDERLKAASR